MFYNLDLILVSKQVKRHIFLRTLLLLVSLQLLAFHVLAQAPTISSFAPESGPIGTSVTISGSNFDATSTNNIVFFGATKATVTAATTTSLTVNVPAGATYQNFSVTNLTNGLTAYSAKPFGVRLAGGIGFEAKYDKTALSDAYSIGIGDLDGDGRSDLVVGYIQGQKISIFLNTSSTGVVSFNNFLEFSVESYPSSVSIGDITGDGKPDLVVASRASSSISVLVNTSSSGSLSFTKTNYDISAAYSTSSKSVGIGDIDGDGRLDLALTQGGTDSKLLSTRLNTSTSGTVSFSSKNSYATEKILSSLNMGDLNGDGKPDLVVTNPNVKSVSVFLNTSTKSGESSFSAKKNYPTGNGPSSVSIGDLNGDGKPDLAVVNNLDNSVSILRNISSTGMDINADIFDLNEDFITGNSPQFVSIGDIDGDGNPDLAVANSGTINNPSNTVSILRNISTPNVPFSSSSFSAKVDYITESSPRSVAIGDLDNDGRPDLAVATYSKVSVLLQSSISANYDALSGILQVSGDNFIAKSGELNDISVKKLTLSGEGGAAYTLTSEDVEISSASSFSITLNAADQTAVNQIFNKNGTISTGGTLYNLAAAEDWNAGNMADLTGNSITVSNVSAPTIISATYDVSTGSLVVTGTGFSKVTLQNNDIITNRLTLTGEGGSTYALTSPNVDITSGTSFTIALNLTDQAVIRQILNKNGTSSTDGTLYNLAAADNWNAGADPNLNIADLTENGITVSNVAIPTITSSAYNASTGVLVVTGTGFLKSAGSDVDVTKMTITGQGGLNHVLTSANVEITSDTRFSITLIANDKSAVNAILNKTGTSSTGGTTYNLAAAEDWNAGADVNLNIADPVNGITVSYPLPTITSFTPTSAATGATITLTGTNFIGVTAVSFGGTAASSFEVVSATSITAVVSAGTSGSISVTNPGGTGMRAGFTFIPAPVITSFTPTSAATGATVTLTGTNFTGVAAVSFGGIAATSFNFVSATSITAVVAAGTSGTVSVTTPGGTGILAGFTHIPPAPVITSFNPNSVGSTTIVTLTGTNFLGATAVSFGGTAATSFEMVSETSITAVVAAGASGNVSVTTPGGTGTLSGFTFIPAPVITSFTPTNAGSTTTVTLTGSNFTGATTVSFGGTAATSFDEVSATSITAVVAAGTSGIVSVTTPGGTGTLGGFIFLSSNANLSALTTNSGTLSPDFASETISYTASVPFNTTSITVSPTKTDANAAITVNGVSVISGNSSESIPLTVGSNLITIIVTAQDGSTTKTYSLTVSRAKGDQVITFPALSPKTFGDAPFDLTATGGASGNPITYTSSNLSVATISGNTVTILGAGTSTITASQAGNANYNAATDVAQTLTVGKASQAISFSALPSKTFGDAPFDLSATGGASGNAITYTSSNTSIATVSGNTVTILGAGTSTITASQSGNTNYDAAADVAQTLTVGKASQTINFGTLTSKTFGDAPFDLSATGGASGNAITYTSSNEAVATVSGNTLTILGAGTSTITASQAGNANYDAAADVAQTLTVGKASQAINFGTLTSKTFGDAPFDLSATGGASGNAITYTSSNEAVATVSGNTLTILGAGTSTITASQAGNANYNAATDVAQTLTVGKASQAISFSALPTKTFGDVPFDLSATGGASGNPITYTSSNLAVATVSGNTITILAAGTTIITASQAGNDNYNAATDVAQTLTVGKASQAISFSALPTKTFGDVPFDLSATGGASGNPITYTSSNQAIATVSGNTVTILAAGTTIITASQAGNDNYNAATDAAQTLTVGKASQTINFAALPSKTFGDAPFDLSATGGASGNALTYTSSNEAVATVSGNTVTILGAGTTIITASQAGNDNYNAATDVVQTLTVGKASQTISFTALPIKTFGDAPFGLSATGGASGNAITYTSSNEAVATVSGNTVTIIGVGTSTITASQAGNTNYDAAVNATQTLTVGKASQTINFGALTSKTFGDAPFDLSATGGASGNAITYTSSNTLVATVTGSTITIIGAGTTIITASQAGNDNYNAATDVAQTLTVSDASQTLPVGKASQAINFSALPAKTFGDAPFGLSATGGASGNTITYTSSNPSVATVTGSTITIIGAGTSVITASQAGNANYNAAADVAQTLTVLKASQTINFSALPAKTFGDAPFGLSATGGASGNAITYTSSNEAVATVTGSTITIIGAGTSVITASQAGNANYNAAADVAQTLTVLKASQTINFASLPAKTFGDAPFGLSATGGASGNIITYTSSNPSVATVTGSTITIIGAGTAVITASQAGNDNYNAALDIAQTLTVGKASQTINFASLPVKTFGDVPFGLSATGGASGNTITYTSSNPSVATVTGSTITIIGAGTSVITASQAGNANYNAASDIARTLTVEKALLIIRALDKTKNQGEDNPVLSKIYNGFIGTDNTSVLLNPTLITTTASKISPAGSYLIKVSDATAENYKITFIDGTLTVVPVLNNSPTNILLSKADIDENNLSATTIGILSSIDPDASNTFSYSLVSGFGSADNDGFSIVDNKLIAVSSFDFESKSTYSIRIQTRDQGGLTFEKAFLITINDVDDKPFVNQAPTLNEIANQTLCFTNASQTISLSGITPGPESAQTTLLSVSSSNSNLIANLSVSAESNGTAILSYSPLNTAGGTAIITVTVKDNGGTSNGGMDSYSRTFNLSINPLPVVNISSNIGAAISKGLTAELTASGGTSYQWANAQGIISGQNSSVLKVRPELNTKYTVMVSNGSGCSTTQSIDIQVINDYKALIINNVLSPNGDGKNDFLIIKNLDMYPNNTLRIFDKAGREIYTKLNYNNDWDGTYNGSALVEDTYFYILDFGSNLQKLKGFVSIVR